MGSGCVQPCRECTGLPPLPLIRPRRLLQLGGQSHTGPHLLPPAPCPPPRPFSRGWRAYPEPRAGRCCTGYGAWIHPLCCRHRGCYRHRGRCRHGERCRPWCRCQLGSPQKLRQGFGYDGLLGGDPGTGRGEEGRGSREASEGCVHGQVTPGAAGAGAHWSVWGTAQCHMFPSLLGGVDCP